MSVVGQSATGGRLKSKVSYVSLLHHFTDCFSGRVMQSVSCVCVCVCVCVCACVRVCDRRRAGGAGRHCTWRRGRLLSHAHCLHRQTSVNTNTYIRLDGRDSGGRSSPQPTGEK